MLKKIWQSKLTIPIIFFLALLIRVYFATLPAHPYDVGTYQAWGKIMLEKGPEEFFKTTWSDYLPLPIFFIGAITYLVEFFHLNFSLFFKLIVTLVETALFYAVYQNTALKRKYLLLPLLLLSPALIGDSAFWGQLDTLTALLGTLALVLALRQSPSHFLPGFFFALAIGFKPIMILLAPVLIIVGYKQKILWSNTLIAVLVFFLTSFPAAPGLNLFFFLKSKTLEQASTYPFRTINAFNFWNINNPLNLWPPDSASVFGISAHALGLILFIILSSFLFLSWSRQKFNLSNSPQVAGMVFLIFYTFTTRMHERHLFFALPFLALAILKNSAFTLPYLLLTSSFTLNLWGAYYWVIHDQNWPFSYLVTQVISWITVFSTIYLLTPHDFWHHFKNWFSSHKLLTTILIFATILRLSGLGSPSEYIFDEVYHAFTAREYIHNRIEAWEWWTTPPPGVAYEWTHPPLAKYGMSLGMWLFGENAFGWRFFSALAGVASIMALYYLLKLLTNNKQVALLAAFLSSIEGLHLVQSRIAMNDIYMLVFFSWALVLALKNRFRTAAILYGLALGSKWSALYGIFPLILIYLHSLKKFSLSSVFTAIRLILIAFFVYLLIFTPFLLVGHDLKQLYELHRQMWYYHTHLVATHDYQSVPWQWILSLRPVWYYVNYGTNVANIYVQGNPLILWFGLVALVLLFKKIFTFRYGLLYLLFFIFTAPWIISPRIMFFYHYLPSAFFLTGILSLWLSTLSKKSIYLILSLMVICFILLSPMYFGIHMPKAYWNTLFALFPSWK